jgi:hypothetical protein
MTIRSRDDWFRRVRPGWPGDRGSIPGSHRGFAILHSVKTSSAAYGYRGCEIAAISAVTPLGLLEIHRRFRTACYLRLQSRRITHRLDKVMKFHVR